MLRELTTHFFAGVVKALVSDQALYFCFEVFEIRDAKVALTGGRVGCLVDGSRSGEDGQFKKE
jgi:hypothetical protein